MSENKLECKKCGIQYDDDVCHFGNEDYKLKWVGKYLDLCLDCNTDLEVVKMITCEKCDQIFNGRYECLNCNKRQKYTVKLNIDGDLVLYCETGFNAPGMVMGSDRFKIVEKVNGVNDLPRAMRDVAHEFEKRLKFLKSEGYGNE